MLTLRRSQGDFVHEDIAQIAVEDRPAIGVVAADVQCVGEGARDIRDQRGHVAGGGDVHDLRAIGEDFELPRGLHDEAEYGGLSARDGIGRAAARKDAVAPHVDLSGAVADAEHESVVEEIDDRRPTRARRIAHGFHRDHDRRAIDRYRRAGGALPETVAIRIPTAHPLHAITDLDSRRTHCHQRLSRRLVSRPRAGGAAGGQRRGHRGEEQIRSARDADTEQCEIDGAHIAAAHDEHLVRRGVKARASRGEIPAPVLHGLRVVPARIGAGSEDWRCGRASRAGEKDRRACERSAITASRDAAGDARIRHEREVDRGHVGSGH